MSGDTGRPALSGMVGSLDTSCVDITRTDLAVSVNPSITTKADGYGVYLGNEVDMETIDEICKMLKGSVTGKTKTRHNCGSVDGSGVEKSTPTTTSLFQANHTQTDSKLDSL